MKDLFLKLTDKLKAVPTIKWVDSDEGQLEFPEHPPVQFPCALIDVEFPDCEDIHETEQQVTALITIRLAFKPSGRSNSAVPVLQRTKAFERFDTTKAVFKALQGWEDAEMSSWSRKSQVTEKRDDNLKVIVQTWETTFGENTD